MIIKLKSILQSKVVNNGVWLLILQGCNTIIPLLTTPYITRVMSKDTFGEFSLALNWIGYLQVIVEYGFTLSGSRKIATAKNREEYLTVRSSIFWGRLFLLLVCIVLFAALQIVFFENKALCICMIILFFMVISIVFQQTFFFQGISEMKNIAIINIFGRLISLVLMLSFVKNSSDLYLYCVFYAVNMIFANVCAFFIVEKKYKVKLKKVKFISTIVELKDGWSLFLSMAMTKIFGSIGVTILGFVSTTEIVGAYSAIYKVPFILTLAFTAFSQSLYPQSCKKFSESFKYGVESTKKYAIPILMFFTMIGAILVIFHKFIVGVAFGEAYIGFSSLLIPFVIWVVVGIINNFLGIQILVSSGHQKEYSRNFIMSAVFMIVAMLVLGFFWNAYGIAIASMCSEMLLSILLIKDILKIYKMSFV